jgi:hypothetical protein
MPKQSRSFIINSKYTEPRFVGHKSIFASAAESMITNSDESIDGNLNSQIMINLTNLNRINIGEKKLHKNKTNTSQNDSSSVRILNSMQTTDPLLI